MSNTVLTINFTNYSSQPWDLKWSYYSKEVAVSNITQSPSNTLDASSGQTTFQYKQNTGGIIASGSAGIECCYQSGSTRIGVKLWAPLNIGPFGESPYWYYSLDSGSPTPPNWDRQSSASQEYTWTNIPFNITATPVAGSSTLTLGVVINSQSSSASRLKTG